MLGKQFRLAVLATVCFAFIGCSSQSSKTPERLPEPAAPEKEIAGSPELMSEAEINRVGDLYGSLAEARVRYWQALIIGNQDVGEQRKLQKVNNFFNEARFVDDIDIWKHSDYWATPLEFLIMDAGDCEDFSVAKYFTLKQMGVSGEKMRMTAVKAMSLNKAHMVLAYYAQPTEEPLILDNIEPRILPASQRGDLKPIYSFNSDDLWLARTRTQQQKAGKSDTIKSWYALKERRLAGVPLIQQVLIPQR